MKKRSKVFFVIVILLLITLIIVDYIYIKKLINSLNETDNVENNILYEEETENNIEISDYYFDGNLTDESTFFYIEDKINEFYKTLKQNEIAKGYSLLNKAFAKNSKITEENILSELNIKTSFLMFKVNSVYQEVIKTDENSANMYHVSGTMYFDNGKIVKENTYIIFVVDYINNTYSIAPMEDIDLNDVKFNDIIEETERKYRGQEDWNNDIDYVIDKNDYNAYSLDILDETQIMQKYFDRYNFYAIYDKEKAYNHLSNDTKNSKFQSIEEYEKYINENIQKIVNTYISAYKIEYSDTYVRYIIKDIYDTYYIFNVKSINDYTITIQ